MVALQITNVFKGVILGLPFVSFLHFSNVLPYNFSLNYCFCTIQGSPLVVKIFPVSMVN